ncbi:MAG: DeoR/GlpR family DNA-binding transcription regulator [Lachnospiraceae bacterium]|nr:DeoR/GlpR family DNA-binding transcription regulator [Lachnospiraceae bacterium]
MYTQERKNIILSRLHEFGSVSSQDLAQELKVSRETIRRDIAGLEKEGLLVRTHGGALPAAAGSVPSDSAISTISGSYGAVSGQPSFSGVCEAPLAYVGSPAFYSNPSASDTSFASRYPRNLEEKKLVAKKAASIIEDKDTIFLDNSTTIHLLLDYLPRDLQLTIITNSIQILLKASTMNLPYVSLISLAGFYNPANYCLYGSRTLQSMEGYYPDKCFLSCTGLSQTRMLTDICLDEVDTKQAILNKSRHAYLLVDHSKFGKDGPFHFASFDQIDYIVTDHFDHSPDNQAFIDLLKTNYGIQVIEGNA